MQDLLSTASGSVLPAAFYRVLHKRSQLLFALLALAFGGGAGSGAWLTVTGISPLSLVNALAKPIKSLTQYGKCTQSGTPTPSAPVDIMCNNGALRMVDDELPSGYKRVLGFTCNNNAFWQITDFKLRGSDTVKISFAVSAACNVWGCYQSTSATDNYDLYATTTSGGKYLRYGDGTYSSYFSPDDLNKRFDVTYTPTGTQGMPEDSTWTAAEFESANSLIVGSTSTGGSSSKLKGNLYGNFIVENNGAERLHLVPCERVSDSVLGYYDTVGGAFYEPYTGYTGAVSLGYDGSHYSFSVVGTPETLTVSATGETPQTVTDIPMLLSVGDYADEVELIGGLLTRNCAVIVLTGNEDWLTSSSIPYKHYCHFPSSIYGDASTMAPLCTHFEPAATPTWEGLAPGECLWEKTATQHDLDIYTDGVGLNDFKAFLAAQYAAGTPVMVVVPQAASTDQTTPHALHTADGDNTVSWTAEVSGTTKTVEYMTGGDQPSSKVGEAKVGEAKAA